MKTIGKFIASLLLLVLISANTYGAYDVVSCDSSPDFAANSCTQCFSGGEASEGDNRGLLTDVWGNTGDAAQVLFKEEQDMPQILALGGAIWKEIKASDSVNFWQYTPELEALYDEDQLGYTLDGNSSVTWLESTLGSAYQLVSNPAVQGANIAMIIYDIAVHNVETDGNITIEPEEHRECVLITSKTTDTPPVTPPELPKTGPEHIFLALIALLLGFGFLKFRKQA